MCRFSAFGSGIVASLAIGKYSRRSSFVTGCGATPIATGHAGSLTAANCGLGPLGAPSEDPFVVELFVEEPPGAWPAAPCAAFRLPIATNTSTKAPTIRIRISALLRQANPPPSDVSISYVCAEVCKRLPSRAKQSTSTASSTPPIHVECRASPPVLQSHPPQQTIAQPHTPLYGPQLAQSYRLHRAPVFLRHFQHRR